MKNSQYRPTQTQVKHEILARYLDAWGGIIINGLRHAKHQRVWQFVYVDCFAYKGKYAGDQENIFRPDTTTEPVYGSPIIGIRALDKMTLYAASTGIQIVTNTILIEKDPTHYRDLQATLQECGLARRVQETQNFFSLHHGEIAIVSGDVINIGDKLKTYTDRSGVWAFYLIDPFGPSGIPYDFVKKIVQVEHHDVMINFIYEDLLRKTGMALNEDLGPQHKQLVNHWENAYGSKNWNQIVIKPLVEDTPFMIDGHRVEDKEQALVYGYQHVLESMDPAIAIKLIALQFPDKDRTMFYLFLTTHDPTGALLINQILYEAKFLEYELRYKFNTLRHIPRGQMSFLDLVQDVPKPPAEDRTTIEAIANEIYQRLQGKVLTRRQVYYLLADTLFFPPEIESALKLLKRQGKLIYDGNKLTHRTEIRFTVETDRTID